VLTGLFDRGRPEGQAPQVDPVHQVCVLWGAAGVCFGQGGALLVTWVRVKCDSAAGCSGQRGQPGILMCLYLPHTLGPPFDQF
jgi:hypothetical protein